ncbi:hypothetical protein ccbrp13_63450 [Ktedonobacteria bacterium brp13]|nr:hypothetical protein ccbrp13_63450 [Ktedonobacteria bacterium brp13]
MFLPNKHFFKHAFSCDEYTELAEEPDQRGLCAHALLIHHEKIRVMVLLVSFLVLLCGFLCVLLIHTVVPLLVAIIIIFLGYRSFDAFLRVSEHTPPT